MGSSFALTLARLESMVQKLNIALTNTRYMWETGNADLTYEVAMRLADVAERTVLLARALPACTGNPIAAIEIQNLIDVSIRVDVGFTQEGWFSVRMPLLLPKKESGSADYVRSFLYPAMKDFFRCKSPVRYTNCVLIYRHVYAKTRPERKRRDHDNIEINMVSDIIALYVMEDDAPSFCRHYYCSAAAMEERTEVYVVPNEDFPLTSFPGKLGAYLEMLREQSWEEMPTVTQLIERESTGGHIMESIMQMILSYAKYGEIKYGEEPLTDQRIQIVFSLLPALDSSVTNTSGKERWNIVNLILIRCWKYVQDYIEIRKRQHEEAEAAGTAGTLSQMISEELQALVGSSSIGEGASQPVPDSVTSCPAANAQKRAETKTVAKKSKEGTASEDGGDALSTEPDKTEGNSSDASLQQPGDEAKTGLEGICSREGKQEVTAEETGRIPYQQTERVSEPSDGTVERNNAYERERYAGAASDVERLLDKMAERAACTQLENERLRELNDAAQGISYGDVHAGVAVCINRIAEVDEELVEQYNTIW